jgi:hypothetical protein
MRDVVVGWFAVRAVGQEPRRGGLLLLRCFHIRVSLMLLGLELPMCVMAFKLHAAFGKCLRYSVGDSPMTFLKTRLKCVSDWNPNRASSARPRCCEVGFLSLRIVDVHAEFLRLRDRALVRRPGRFVPHHLAGLRKPMVCAPIFTGTAVSHNP